MKCPHCLHSIHDYYKAVHIKDSGDGHWVVIVRECPECHRTIVHLTSSTHPDAKVMDPVENPKHFTKPLMVWPKGNSRPPCPQEVPPDFAKDYIEACLVLPDSPKASAALSRRCLQHILEQKTGVKRSDLAKEIQEVLDSGTLPSYISQVVDAVRNVGNFAAHPIKSNQTGTIIDVEPEEAELNLDVIEALFDFYFVQPSIVAKKTQALNIKLQSVGKPPIKI